MKLFWKIYFSAVLLSAVCVLACGHGMISVNFRAGLNQEAETALEYGAMLTRVLRDELDEAASGRAAGVLSGRGVRVMDQALPFAVLDEGGAPVFSSLARAPRAQSAPDRDTAGWTVYRQGEELSLEAAYPLIAAGGRQFTVITARDVTWVYRTQQAQYQSLTRILAGMSAVLAVAAYFLARFLLKDVRDLMRVTRRIAAGDMGVRAVPRGEDEISLLSARFNAMADRLDGKMRQLREEAERKELFVGAFSHELKTPLTSIIGYADLLRRPGLDAEEQRLCAEYIFSEGRRLERLSMRLLELIVLRRAEAEPVPVEVSALLEGVRLGMRPRLEEKEASVRWEADPARVRMEADLMKTVFLNLVDNACKAIEPGDAISLRGRRQGRDYIVTIADSGCGMTPEDLRRARDAFYMADKSRSRSQGGAGLGLAICDAILDMHHFTLTYESEPGKGTRATVRMKGAVVTS